MPTLTTKAALGLAVVAGTQTAAIGWMVTDRITLLKTGKEIVLPIVPVDPRSLFRGDYVRIDFPVTMVSSALFPKDEKPRRAGPVFVTMQRQDAGDSKGDGPAWKPVAVSATRPTAAPASGPEQAVMQGRLAHNWWPGNSGTPQQVRINYGLERYYVPEGKGLELENAARNKKLAVVIAVDRQGRSAIKGLIIDGKLAYEEPLL
jgi:uncharacterized membrane-anchored protein